MSSATLTVLRSRICTLNAANPTPRRAVGYVRHVKVVLICRTNGVWRGQLPMNHVLANDTIRADGFLRK